VIGFEITDVVSKKGMMLSTVSAASIRLKWKNQKIFLALTAGLTKANLVRVNRKIWLNDEGGNSLRTSVVADQ